MCHTTTFQIKLVIPVPLWWVLHYIGVFIHFDVEKSWISLKSIFSEVSCSLHIKLKLFKRGCVMRFLSSFFIKFWERAFIICICNHHRKKTSHCNFNIWKNWRHIFVVHAGIYMYIFCECWCVLLLSLHLQHFFYSINDFISNLIHDLKWRQSEVGPSLLRSLL
jgi:hypothetical protein